MGEEGLCLNFEQLGSSSEARSSHWGTTVVGFRSDNLSKQKDSKISYLCLNFRIVKKELKDNFKRDSV